MNGQPKRVRENLLFSCVYMLIPQHGLTWHLVNLLENESGDRGFNLPHFNMLTVVQGHICSIKGGDRQKTLLWSDYVSSDLSLFSASLSASTWWKRNCLDDMNEKQLLESTTAANCSSSCITSSFVSNRLTSVWQAKEKTLTPITEC